MRFLFVIVGDGCQSQRKFGYTLVEVMLVIITIGVLAAVSLPRFGGGTILYKRKVDSAISRLAVDLRYTRQLAITNSKNYLLHVDPPARTYSIYKEFYNPANQVDETREIDKLISINCQDPYTFIFESKGNAATNSITSCTFAEGGYSKTITIVRATGRIKW